MACSSNETGRINGGSCCDHALTEIETLWQAVASGLSIACLAVQATIHARQRPTDRPNTPEGSRHRARDALGTTIEMMAILCQLGLHSAIQAAGVGRQRSAGAAVALVAWLYVLLLTTTRFALRRPPFSPLWAHAAWMYSALWLKAAAVFCSNMLRAAPSFHSTIPAAADFALNTLLVAIALLTGKGTCEPGSTDEVCIGPCPERASSALARLIFSWATPIVLRGFKQPLRTNDMYELGTEDRTATVASACGDQAPERSIAFTFLHTYRIDLTIQAAWSALSGVLMLAPTILFKSVLEYAEDPCNSQKGYAWLSVCLLFLTGLLAAISNAQALWIGHKLCVRFRAMVIKRLHVKAIRRRVAVGCTEQVLGRTRPQSSDAQASSGAVMNLMSVDSSKAADVLANLHMLWASAPLQVATSGFLLFRILGASAIAGMVSMVLLLPVTLHISQRLAKSQTNILAATDARLETTNEMIENIRTIKYLGWEPLFVFQAEKKRATEMTHLRSKYRWWAVAAAFWAGMPIAITLVSFFLYTIVYGHTLRPSVAFSALSLFQLLRIPLDQFAELTTKVQEARASLFRIQSYLNEPETTKYEQLSAPIGIEDADEAGERQEEEAGLATRLDHATFCWNVDKNGDFRLQDITLEFRVGKLNVIVGSIGSGKTSLLMAILGEMPLVSGSIGSTCAQVQGTNKRRRARVAYCAQQPWLTNSSIRQNILFGSVLDTRRYSEVLEACCLERELATMAKGDDTFVGEKGVTLSGGQKQRVALARALYSRASCVVLDDVLSALDVQTANWVFEKAITGPLMAQRTCILATNNVPLCLPRASFGVHLDGGRVLAKGRPHELTSLSMLRDALQGRQTQEDGMPDETHVRSTEETVDGDLRDDGSELREESRETGRLKKRVVLMYLRSMGSCGYWATVLGLFAAQQMASVAANACIRSWSGSYTHSESDVSTFKAYYLLDAGSVSRWFPVVGQTNSKGVVVSSHPGTAYYLGIYAGLGFAFMALTALRENAVFAGSMSASRKIHLRLFEAVVHAKIRFFDATPFGQVVSRFSRDMESLDQELAAAAVGVAHCTASLAVILVLVSVIVPRFLAAGLAITAAALVLGRVYMGSAMGLKRLESTRRSPLYQHLGETLSGVSTIRAYGAEARFLHAGQRLVDMYNTPFFHLGAVNRWLGVRVDILGSGVSLACSAFVVCRTGAGRMDAGAAGLAMSYAATFTGNLLWLIRLYTANEQNMNSMERVGEYLDVPQEGPAAVPAKGRAHGQGGGAIDFVDYSAHYGDERAAVLRNLRLKIAAREKIGVVGRTGAGKTSLALALVRALEAASGWILLDGEDLCAMPLQELREKVVMVPQDAVLFNGSVRSNLDPANLHTDAELWDALGRVGLEHCELTAPIRDSGGNISQGQRQLLCLARSLLREPLVLLMDESTASLDANTAARIQDSLRAQPCTTITIAHRLPSIINCDRVVVLEAGRAVEIGCPRELLAVPGSVFAALWRAQQ